MLKNVIQVERFRLDHVKHARSEKKLPDGFPMTHYILGASHMFNGDRMLHLTEADVLYYRSQLAQSLTDSFKGAATLADCNFFASPVVQPMLTVSFKNTFKENHPHKARMLFDLDWTGEAGVPENINWSEFAYEFCDIIDHHTSCLIDFARDVVIYANGFHDKPISAHLIVTNHYFATQTIPDTCLSDLNAYLSTFKLSVDKSIATSGVKVSFSDKWLSKDKTWRGDSMHPVFYPKEIIKTWSDLVRATDPCVVNSDNCDPFNWVEDDDDDDDELPVTTPGGTISDVYVNGQTAEARISEAVPAWKDIAFHVVRKPEGYELWVPQTRACPFKEGSHSSAGKCYATIMFSGTIIIKCHSSKCHGRAIRLRHVITDSMSTLEEQAIAWGNERFAQIHITSAGGSTSVNILEMPTSWIADIKLWSQTEFKKAFTHQRSIYTVQIGQKRVKKILKWTDCWLESPLKNIISDGLEFYPSDTSSSNRYNQWRGFDPVMLAQAKVFEEEQYSRNDLKAACECFTQHVLDCICDGNEDAFTYVLNWIAFTFQRPELMAEVMLVISGPPGCGKGTFCKFLTSMIGTRHSWVVHDGATIYNRFNSEMHQSKLVVLDEAMSKSHKDHTGMLKALTTESKKRTEVKFGAVKMQDTFMNFIITSNDPIVIPVQEKQRRYQMLDASAPDVDDTESYFLDIELERTGDGLPAFYLLMMRRDISDWHPRQIFQNEAATRHVIDALDPIYKWWMSVLRSEELVRWENITVAETAFIIDAFEPADVFGELRIPLRLLDRVAFAHTGIQRKNVIRTLAAKYSEGIYSAKNRISDGWYVIFRNLPTLRKCFESSHGLPSSIWDY